MTISKWTAAGIAALSGYFYLHTDIQTSATPTYANGPTLEAEVPEEASVGYTQPFTFEINDPDSNDDVDYDIYFGHTFPRSVAYNHYIFPEGETSGSGQGFIDKQIRPGNFFTEQFEWNSSTERYETDGELYIVATDSDGNETEVHKTILVFNEDPFLRYPIADRTGYRTISQEVDLDHYFREQYNQRLHYDVSTSNNNIQTELIDNVLHIEPQSMGSTDITVTAYDDYMGESESTTFRFYTENEAPSVSSVDVNDERIGIGDTIEFSGEVSDLEGDATTITGRLGDEVETTSVSSGNGSWTMTFDAEALGEGFYSNATFTPEDAYDTGNEYLHTFSTGSMIVDLTLPALAQHNLSPSEWTNSHVDIQLQLYDSMSGIDGYYNEAGAFINTNQQGAYRVHENGDYDIVFRDNVGNEHTETITVSNIDNTSPSLQTLTLVETDEGLFDVEAGFESTSGIDYVENEHGQLLERNKDGSFIADELSTPPSYVQAFDEAGNSSSPEVFLSQTEIQQTHENYESGLAVFDISAQDEGDNMLGYQIDGSHEECSDLQRDNPPGQATCEGKEFSYNGPIILTNETDRKATITRETIQGITSYRSTIELTAEVLDDGEVTFTWNEEMSSQVLSCDYAGGEVQASASGTEHTMTLERGMHYCQVSGIYGGSATSSNQLMVYPNHTDTPSDNQPTQDLESVEMSTTDVYASHQLMGESYYINLHRGTSDRSNVPFPEEVLHP